MVSSDMRFYFYDQQFLEKIIFDIINMFQNSYQNGTFFEVFDPKTPQDKLKNLYKLQNVQPNYKVFDKNLKTFIYEFVNTNSKITFPREDKKQLYLIQQFLNLQIEFNDADWHLELTVSDLTRTKRRIILSPSVHKIQKKPFFLKFPCPLIQHGIWTNLCIDLFSFIQGFKGQTYRSLDLIQLIGNVKLRRIYTTQNMISETGLENEPHQAIFLPKNFQFPPEIQNLKCYLHFQQHHEETLEPQSQNQSKSTSHIGSTKLIKKQTVSKKNIKQQKPKKEEELKEINSREIHVIEEPKSAKEVVNRDERKFLANTNGLQSLKIKKEEGQQTSKSIIAPLSTGKILKKKRQPLSKTQVQKAKRISIQNKGMENKKEKSPKKVKIQETQKLNPWRSSTNKKHETGRVQVQKIEDERKIESAEATLFKSRNLIEKQAQAKSKQFDRNSDQSRQSDYFQLSQKFSTVTETRFFKNDLGSKKWQEEIQKEAHDQIQENIQVQTNSHYSNSPTGKNKENHCSQIHKKMVEESINDSLDNIVSKKKNGIKQDLTENQSYFNMSSRTGFGEKMMNKYMKQLERPYSPPLGQREHTQQQQADVAGLESEGKGVQLIYDPILNCYYDHKTHTYYALKN